MHDIEVIRDPATAVVALEPARSALLAQLREPASAATLATRTGTSRQRVNYHLRQLEERGLVEVAGTRTWGGLTERQLVASAAGYVVSPEVLGAAASTPARSRDRLSAAYVISLAARVVAEVGDLARRAVRQRKRLPVYGLDTSVRFATPADWAAFTDELSTTVAQLVSKYHDEQASEGRWHRVTIAGHPVPHDADPGAVQREPAGETA